MVELIYSYTQKNFSESTHPAHAKTLNIKAAKQPKPAPVEKPAKVATASGMLVLTGYTSLELVLRIDQLQQTLGAAPQVFLYLGHWVPIQHKQENVWKRGDGVEVTCTGTLRTRLLFRIKTEK